MLCRFSHWDPFSVEHVWHSVAMYYRHILETPASEKEFQENLHELDHKLNFLKEQEFREIAAVVDVQKDVIKLKMKVNHSCVTYIVFFICKQKWMSLHCNCLAYIYMPPVPQAISKTREFLLSKIYQFRKPMANYQMAQNQLLNYRLENQQVLALEHIILFHHL